MPKKKTEEPTEAKKGRPQNKNLKPENLTNLTCEERVRIAKKAGKASAKKRAERKTMKETLELISKMPMHDGELLDLDKVKNVDDLLKANKTLGEQIAVRLAVMAQNGNLKAMELYRDQIGEKPVQTVDVRMDAKVDLDRADIDELLSKL